MRTFQGLVDDDEQGHLASYNLGVLYEKQGKNDRAAEYYEQALEKNASFTSALVNLVRLYLRNGRVDAAENVANNYIEKASDVLDHRAARLEILLYREQYEDVISEAKDVLREDERNVEAMVAMARANFWLERYELAKAVLERASDLAPERPDIYFLFGLVAMENDERERAITNLEEAIELRPQYAEAHNNLGLLYYEAGDFEGAAEQFQAALDDHPEFEEARLNLGNAYKNMGKLEKAEVQFQKVVENDGDYADAYFNLGVLYLDGQVPGMKKIPRLEKAIETLKRYKQVAGADRSDDDPADKYIKSAREKIEAEKQRQQMMRQSQKQSGGGDGSGN